VAVERKRVKLRQNEYFSDATIDAVAHGDIYESITPTNWNLRISFKPRNFA